MIAPTPLSGKVWESHGQRAVSEASSGVPVLDSDDDVLSMGRA
jgi:hypothetical protein